MERRSFFSAEINRTDLESKAHSSLEVDRWLAAVALQQVHEDWSFDLLWSLKVDSDEHTRTAALSALRTFPPSFFESSAQGATTPSSFAQGIWKVRPLPVFNEANSDLYLAAVIDLVAVEGAVTGGRINSRLSLATIAGCGSRVSQGRVKTLLKTLLDSNLLTRADAHLGSGDLSLWILHAPGTMRSGH
jgi:hypothetical protein